jgi:uncharacterized protein (TIGR00251 family)
VLELHVQPGAKRTEVAGLHDGRLKVRLAARAVDGAANAALIAFLAEKLALRKNDIRLESGLMSRRKRLSVPASGRVPPQRLLGARS